MAKAPSSIIARAASIDVICVAAPIRQLFPRRAARAASPSKRHTTFPDIEAIVPDARSRDRTREIARSTPLGSLVIGSVFNGLDLLAQPSEIKYMVEGAILLVAVSIDAVARRSRSAAGR
jgi:hypothetical protein